MNTGIEALQASALTLGYAAKKSVNEILPPRIYHVKCIFDNIPLLCFFSIGIIVSHCFTA